MFKSLFKRKSKYEKFWKNFKAFEEIMFFELQENSQDLPMLESIKSEIKHFHPDLDLDYKNIGNKIELFITANGVKDAFPEVEKLVDVAPSFKNWRITAFKQRVVGDDFEIEYGGLRIGYKDIYFKYNDSEAELGVQLYIKNYEKNDEFINGTYKLLNALLGEYDIAYNIGYIDWDILNENEKNHLLPFIKLREIVDLRK